MTVDGWKKQRDAERDDEPIRLSEVWDAATKAEREACAKVCEVAGVARIATLHDWTRIVGDELAAAIRERSNAPGNKPPIRAND